MLPWLDEAREVFLPRAPAPLTVEALLRSPVSIDPQHPLMLEGVLACAVIALVTSQPPDEVGLGVQTFVDIPVPIADGERVGLQVARASQAEGTGIGVVRYVRKRTRTEMLGLRRVSETNEYKAYNLPVVGRLYTILRWHVVGDGEQIEQLLRHVHALGRGRQGGLGEVAGWRVRPAAQDESWTRDGVPTRPLPVDDRDRARIEFGPSVQTCMIGYRAPYWHPETRRLCAVPPLPSFAGEVTE